MSEPAKEKSAGTIDWLFIVFLFLFTNQAILSLKVAGILLVFLLRPNFKFKFGSGRIPRFYLYIILLSVFNLLLFIRDFSTSYLVAFAVANMFWFFGFLAFHQLKLSLEEYGPASVYRTMQVFTIINFICSIFQLGQIIFKTGHINPYTGLDFPYGMSTGDNIYGAFLQNSYYNMMVSAMLVFYFIFKRHLGYAIISLLSLILVFGNFGTIIFLSVLSAAFIVGLISKWNRGKIRWLSNVSPPGKFQIYIPIMVFFLSVLYTALSPENMNYLVEKVTQKVFTSSSNDVNNYRAMLENQKMDPAAFDPYKEYQQKSNVTPSFYAGANVQALNVKDRLAYKMQITNEHIEKLQGKALSIQETRDYLKSSIPAFLFGAGPVRFSSLLAQKMAGFDSSRLFMNILPHYVSPLYAENHKLIIESRIKSDSKNFSNANWPDCFFNQIFGEYGILGFLLFAIFYAGHFVRDIKYWSYGLWVFILLIPYSYISYIFEALSVVVFFELLMETDIAEGKQKLLRTNG